MTVPNWVQDAIFYQIFPDRFNKGNQDTHSTRLQAWGSEPTHKGFMGGDLLGIVQKFDYLLDLGINAIYLNPIFSSAANHRYHTNDYYKIDPTLGTMTDFKSLIKVAHTNNVKVILDGVFNHTGRGFFAFNDVMENGPESRYLDWYHVNNFPLNAFTEGEAENYRAWWNIKDLPKLNTDTKTVRKYLMDVARFWIEQGADGWRLDVPSEIDDDEFWEEFRSVVKTANPEAYTVGEIWELDSRWVGEKQFDGLMHYPLRNAIFDLFVKRQPIVEFANQIEGFIYTYPKENVFGMYLPLGSHDTRRIMNKFEGSIEKIKLASIIQFSYPGAPAIYYGDEVGMDGGKDPDNRRSFSWNENDWNEELRAHFKKIIEIRKNSGAIRRGDFKQIFVEEGGSVYAYARVLDDEKVLIAINASDSERIINIPVGELKWQDGLEVLNLLSGERYGINEGIISLEIPPWGGMMIGKI